MACRKLLDAWEKALPKGDGSTWPVIVFDEANVLMGWDKHPVELASMLRLFVQITKEDNRGHVLMATSDSGFQVWMHNSEWSLV